MKKYKVTIITPVYKAEKFIERCIISLLNQDMDDIEYIFINDASPDQSFKKIKQIIEKNHRKDDVILLENNKNLGVGVTRRKGMLIARGKYVIQIDSDDWIEPNMISTLYKKIEEEKNDIIVSDYYISINKNRDKYIKEHYKSDINYNLKNILLGNSHPSFCLSLIRREFYLENNLIPSGDINMSEDIQILFKLFSITDKVSYIPKAFLHYTQYNIQSITKNLNESKIKDTIIMLNTIENILKEKNQDSLFEYFYSMAVFQKKMFVLDKNYIDKFYTIYPESNKLKYIFNYKGYGLSQKIAMSFMIFKMPYITRFIYKAHIWIRKHLKS